MKPGTKADFFAKTLGPKGSFVATRMRGPTHPLKNQNQSNFENQKLNLNLKQNYEGKQPTEMRHVAVDSSSGSNSNAVSPAPTPVKVPESMIQPVPKITVAPP